MTDYTILIVVTIIYLIAIAWLGFYAWTRTKTTADYLVAGRRAHPIIMALSYGATFISTSAIVGFGGAAANLGMGLLWLTFFNIFVGIFVAFVFFGRRTRRMGHNLNAHTFPELLGRRYQSRFIQFFTALVIFLFMPLYASAVLLGAAKFIIQTFRMEQAMDPQAALYVAILIYTVIVALYVIAGGLKGVMWTDALQGAIMLLGMVILVVYAYMNLGGVVKGHQELSHLRTNLEANAAKTVENYNKAAGAQLTLDSALQLGGEATTVKNKIAKMSDDEKAKYFAANSKDDDVLKRFGALAKTSPGGMAGLVAVKGMEKAGWRGWTAMPTFGMPMWSFLVTTIVLGVGIGVLAQPQLAVRFMTVKSGRELNRAVPTGGFFILMMTGVAFVVGALSNVFFFGKTGDIAIIAAAGDVDRIIPLFINQSLPHWFVALFTLTLLSAAMSTQSSQFHTIGTALGRDIYEQTILGGEHRGTTVLITRIGITIGIVVTLIISWKMPPSIIAPATAIFFGLCASSFLPMFFAGLYFRGVTKAGAIAGMCAGFFISVFWLSFVQMVSMKFPAVLLPFIGKAGQVSLFPAPWRFLDALVIAFPIAVVVTFLVSLATRKMSGDHLNTCFHGFGGQANSNTK